MLLFILASCAQKKPVAEDAVEEMKDQVRLEERMKEVEAQVQDGNIKRSDSAPVKMVGLTLIGSTVSLAVSNPTTKTVDGLRLSIFFRNNFGEIVASEVGNKSILIERQNEIAPGKAMQVQTNAENFQGATKVFGYIEQVHFTDGSDWKLD